MDLINDLQEAEHLLEMHDTSNIQEQTERILKGLGFDVADFTKAMKDLSGGWQMRVELAKILLQKPQLILLDEHQSSGYRLDTLARKVFERIQWSYCNGMA